MSRLKPNKTWVENGVTVHEKIIPWGAKWTKASSGYKKGDKYKADRLLSGGTGKVRGVTIHNTDGNADAETYTRATYPNQNMKTSRVHYYVDDKEAWQNLKDIEVGWHAGDGRGNGNETTISIEILLKGKAVKDGVKAEDNGARLAAALLNKYGLTINQLYTHKNWSGKNCPINILPRWETFKNKVKGYMKTTEKNREDRVNKGYLQVGDSGEDVKTLQSNLIKAGYSVGNYKADGIYGKDTERAVISLQKEHKLKVDGIAGRETQEKIKELLTPEVLYRVIAGSYRDRVKADNLVKSLKKEGHGAFIDIYKNA